MPFSFMLSHPPMQNTGSIEFFALLMLKKSMTESDAIIEQILTRLEAHPEVTLAVLYGSVASGRISQQSDVDLAISSKEGLEVETCLSLSLQLTRILNREVSVVDMDKMEGVILHEVLTKGVFLKRDPDALVRHVFRLQEFTEDVLPFHEMAFQIKMGRVFGLSGANRTRNLSLMKKVESLHRCLERLREKRPEDLGSLESDLDLQDILSVNLERAIQISVDVAAMILAKRQLPVSNTMAGNFQGLSDVGILSSSLSEKLQRSVGFRNISVHEYTRIDWALVFDLVHNHLNNFEEFIASVLKTDLKET